MGLEGFVVHGMGHWEAEVDGWLKLEYLNCFIVLIVEWIIQIMMTRKVGWGYRRGEVEAEVLRS